MNRLLVVALLLKAQLCFGANFEQDLVDAAIDPF